MTQIFAKCLTTFLLRCVCHFSIQSQTVPYVTRVAGGFVKWLMFFVILINPSPFVTILWQHDNSMAEVQEKFQPQKETLLCWNIKWYKVLWWVFCVYHDLDFWPFLGKMHIKTYFEAYHWPWDHMISFQATFDPIKIGDWRL